MRIAIMAWGGAEFLGVWNYYMNMARVLERHLPEAQVCIFHPPDLPDARRREIEETTGEPGAELPRRARHTDIMALAGRYDREFARRFATERIDVVYEQAKFLGRDFPIPVLSWIGDLQHRALPEYFTRGHRLQRDLGFWSQARFRKHVVVSSQSARRDLLRFIARPRAEIHVVPFALRLTTAVTDRQIAAVRSKYGLPERYLFLPNQMWRHKNHAAALRALALLADRDQRRILALSGPRYDYRHPDHAAELGRLVEELGIESHLRWLGTVPYEDLLHLVAGAEVLVNPSFFEGWSTTVEEAKTLATPMALSNLDVHVEQAAGHARFFDPRDPAALADAVDAAAAGAPPDRAAARVTATARNVADQEAYADRLRRALEAAIRDHRRL